MIPNEKDFQLFGITTDSDLAALKKSYRRLLKKYHPDLNTGSKEYDLKVIGIVSAYQRLQGFFRSRSIPQESGQNNSISGEGVDYDMYKRGLFFYEQLQVIDPLDWLALRRAEIASKRNELFSNLSLKTLSTLEALLFNTSRSIYYFSLLSEECPASPWCDDARAKIAYLNQNLKIFLETKGYLQKAVRLKKD